MDFFFKMKKMYFLFKFFQHSLGDVDREDGMSFPRKMDGVDSRSRIEFKDRIGRGKKFFDMVVDLAAHPLEDEVVLFVGIEIRRLGRECTPRIVNIERRADRGSWHHSRAR